jgi:hypothetical protein
MSILLRHPIETNMIAVIGNVKWSFLGDVREEDDELR